MKLQRTDQMRRASRHRAGRAGFTLFELVMVLLIIAVVTAVAAPRILPAIAVSEHEGAARHIANYGRAAVVHCGLLRERITIKIDLDQQAIYAVAWMEEQPSWLRDETEEDTRTTQEQRLTSLLEDDPEALLEKAEELHETFERFVRMSMYSRIRNVRSGRISEEFTPLFEERFTLRDEPDDEDRMVKNELLRRFTPPDGIAIEAARMGSRDYQSGVLEVEVTPTGMLQTVEFYVRNARGDYYTVVWDAITGGTRWRPGKEDAA